MKRRIKIPTIIAVLFLIVGISFGISILSSDLNLNKRASPDKTPRDVKVSNITNDSFSVSWLTTSKSVSYLKLGDRVINDLVDNDNTHYVNVENLESNKTYSFTINSDGAEFNNQGSPWQVTTGGMLIEGQPINIQGSVLRATGTPAMNSIVLINIEGASPISALTSSNGNFVANLAIARNTSLDSFIVVDYQTTLLDIFVSGGTYGTATARIYPKSANPIPSIILGQVHDFTDLAENLSVTDPNAEVTTPEDFASLSRFEVPSATSSPSGKAYGTVSLAGIEEGETIKSVKPEFFGTGPANLDVKIIIESQAPIEASVKIKTNGEWSYSPTDKLTEGQHKITLEWIEGSVTKKLTRNFIVQAADGPAFVASGSKTPGPGDNPISTGSATKPPQPESGNGMNTLIMGTIGGILILGAGLLFAL